MLVAAGAAAIGSAALFVREIIARRRALELDVGRVATVSDVILGGSGFAGMFQPITDAEVSEILSCALELGIRDVDTAPHYGLGLSEERIGAFISSRPLLKPGETPLRVWTKVGRLVRTRADVAPAGPIPRDSVQWDNAADSPTSIFKGVPPDRIPVLDYSAAGARTSFAESRKRLHCPSGDWNQAGAPGAIVGLRVHDCESDAVLEAAGGEDGAIASLASLRAAGKIKHAGIGVNDASYAMRALHMRGGDIDVVMIAGSWNLLDQSALSLLLHCQRKGIAVHNAGIFASGLLVGGDTYRYAPAPRMMVDRARRWRALCGKHGCGVVEAAVAFALLPKAVTKIAVGVKSCGELTANVHAVRKAANVPAALWREAIREGLLPRALRLT